MFIVLLVVGLSCLIPDVYGFQYRSATIIVAIISFGYLFDLLCGPVVMVLNISGFEGMVMRSYKYAIVANILLGCALVVPFKMYGVAIATAVVTIGWGGALSVCFYKKSGFYTSLPIRFLTKSFLRVTSMASK